MLPHSLEHDDNDRVAWLLLETCERVSATLALRLLCVEDQRYPKLAVKIVVARSLAVRRTPLSSVAFRVTCFRILPLPHSGLISHCALV